MEPIAAAATECSQNGIYKNYCSRSVSTNDVDIGIISTQQSYSGHILQIRCVLTLYTHDCNRGRDRITMTGAIMLLSRDGTLQSDVYDREASQQTIYELFAC